MPLAAFRMKIAALPEPMRIGVGLGLGFAVTLVLVVLVMIVGFNYMSNIQSELEQITKINNVKTELAHTMKYAQRDRAVSLLNLSIASDPFEKDEVLRLFDKQGAEWWEAWQKFQAMSMNTEETELAARINKVARERNQMVLGAVDYATAKHGAKVSEYMRKVVVPGQHELSVEIDNLLELQQQQTRLKVEEAAESYSRTRILLILLCSLTVLIGIAVAVIVFRQVMRQSRELEYKALFDGLTGLPNRALFFDRLNQAAAAWKSTQKPFSVVLFDLDRFKVVNDTLGHHVGDMLLKYVAQNVSARIRRSDTVARLGGDEFVMLLPAASASHAEEIAKKIMQEICRRVNLEGHEVNVALSMGIATYPEHDNDVQRLLLKADAAMYAAKRANAGYRIYTPEIESIAARNDEMQNELRYAIENDQLLVHFQPKISHHSGSIVGVETLVRWKHPQRGLIPPDDFIPLAESTGLIQPLAYWVLRAAMQHCVRWHQAGYDFSVAFNLSTRNLLDGDLPGRVADMMHTYQVNPKWLVFEITESAVMAEPVRALETLNKLNKMGIQLSLDDFGTGYSSLSYLKKLPVREIKIDKSFVKGMELDTSDTVIVRSTIALGHNLRMQVVAEGVENQAVWDLLGSMGCDASQGYYMSRPLSAEDLDNWLKTSDWAREKARSSSPYGGLERRKNIRLNLQ